MFWKLEVHVKIEMLLFIMCERYIMGEGSSQIREVAILPVRQKKKKKKTPADCSGLCEVFSQLNFPSLRQVCQRIAYTSKQFPQVYNTAGGKALKGDFSCDLFCVMCVM